MKWLPRVRCPFCGCDHDRAVGLFDCCDVCGLDLTSLDRSRLWRRLRRGCAQIGLGPGSGVAVGVVGAAVGIVLALAVFIPFAPAVLQSVRLVARMLLLMVSFRVTMWLRDPVTAGVVATALVALLVLLLPVAVSRLVKWVASRWQERREASEDETGFLVSGSWFLVGEGGASPAPNGDAQPAVAGGVVLPAEMPVRSRASTNGCAGESGTGPGKVLQPELQAAAVDGGPRTEAGAGPGEVLQPAIRARPTRRSTAVLKRRIGAAKRRSCQRIQGTDRADWLPGAACPLRRKCWMGAAAGGQLAGTSRDGLLNPCNPFPESVDSSPINRGWRA